MKLPILVQEKGKEKSWLFLLVSLDREKRERGKIGTFVLAWRGFLDPRRDEGPGRKWVLFEFSRR